MLRLTTTATDSGPTVVAAHGWIGGDDLPLLKQELEELLQQESPVVLELSAVRAIDPAGLASLSRWLEMGLKLRGGSAFVRTLLRAHGHEDPA